MTHLIALKAKHLLTLIVLRGNIPWEAQSWSLRDQIGGGGEWSREALRIAPIFIFYIRWFISAAILSKIGVFSS